MVAGCVGDSFPNSVFDSFKGRRIGETFGFASRIFRFQWEDYGEPQSVVVKLWDTDDKAGMGEVLFYQTFEDVGVRIPQCFYNIVHQETKKAVLVLEDLKDAVQGDVLEKLDLSRATGVAHNLAGLHAAWLEHPKLAELPWLSNISIWEPENDWFHSRRDLFLERFPEHLDGLARSLLDKIEFAPSVAKERLKDAPATLLHGDFHLDNILFEKQVNPVFLDWSRPVIGAPAVNLAQLLFTMIPLGDFDTVLDYYFNEFTKTAKITLPRTKLEKQLGGALLRLFSNSTCGTARWQPSLPRAIETQVQSIEKINQTIAFWRGRDPDLFSFIL